MVEQIPGRAMGSIWSPLPRSENPDRFFASRDLASKIHSRISEVVHLRKNNHESRPHLPP